jgi:ribosome-associated protein
MSTIKEASAQPEELSFELRTEYIDLLQLLKATGLCATGGEAKLWVELGAITVDGEPESRKRRKLRNGNTVLVTPVNLEEYPVPMPHARIVVCAVQD